MRPSITALALAAVLIAPVAAHAQLNGASVNGTMWIDGDNVTNYFDPANGYVPAGYGNSSSPNNVSVGGGVEFGFADGSNTDTINLSDSQIVLSDLAVGGSSIQITYTLVSSAFLGLHFNLDSNSFPGLSWGLAGDTLTIITDPFNSDPGVTLSATLIIPAPEPASLTLLAAGAFGLAAIRRRRRS